MLDREKRIHWKSQHAGPAMASQWISDLTTETNGDGVKIHEIQQFQIAREYVGDSILTHTATVLCNHLVGED